MWLTRCSSLLVEALVCTYLELFGSDSSITCCVLSLEVFEKTEVEVANLSVGERGRRGMKQALCTHMYTHTSP